MRRAFVPNHSDTNERISSLETAVEGLHGELGEIKQQLKSISTAVNNSQKTNWGVILSGVLVIIAIWAAAIHPLQNDLERGQKSAETLANAVILQNDKAGALRNDLEIISGSMGENTRRLTEIYERGSPITDKRLTLIEYRLSQSEGKKP